MGLRRAVEKPAEMVPPVLSGAGAAGMAATFSLAIVLLLASAAYIAALLRPPARRVAFAGAAALIVVLLALPALFSADVFAYAYYGDLLLHGKSPYVHAARALDDPLARAAIRAWDGHVPPRCIYGPLAVVGAALADLAGAPFGPTGAIAAQRALALAAFAACALLWSRLFTDARTRIAFCLNPVAIWSAVEGHNDAAMLALALAGFAWPRARPFAIAAATLIKAPALLLAGTLARNRAALAALVLTLVGYVPLAVAVVADRAVAAGAQTAWESPVGLLAAGIGRAPALAVATLALALGALGVQRLPRTQRAAAFAFCAWFALPNAYPWYALWILPLAARDLRSPWAPALLAATLTAPIRAMTDATFANTGTLHVEMVAIQFVPPLAVRALGVLRAVRAVPLALLAILALHGTALAQTTPTPQPLPTPAARPTPTPGPLPTASTTPLPAPPTPPPVTTPTATPTSTPTPNPYGYITTPPPNSPAPGDGPQILEVDLNDRTIHPGGPLLVRVLTSANVIGVEARAMGRFIAIPSAGPGIYALQYTLPSGIPFWLMNKNYDVVIAAATPDGRQITLTVPITVAR